MTWTFVPAEQVKRRASLILGVSGLTGSGKTYSALLLAQHLAKERGGEVYGLDTENGRMADYQSAADYPDLTPYRLCTFEPPFSSERYTEAVLAADAAGAACIVVDSTTDEWDGPGGVLDLHTQTLDRMAGQDQAKRDRANLAAWAVAKPPHKRFANEIFRLKAHLILCFRAQPKTTMKGGKVVDLGLQPICGTDLPYKLRFHLLMHEVGDGGYSVLKAYKHERDVFPPSGRIDADAAARLVASLKNEPPPAETAQEQAPPDPGNDAPSWSLAYDGSHRYVCSGNPDSVEAQRALYKCLKADLEPTAKRTERELKIVRQIATANEELIASLPDEGRTVLRGMIAKLFPD